MPAIEPPLAAIGHDDPIGHALFQRGDHALARVHLGRLPVQVEVGTIEPAIPRINEGRRPAPRGREQNVGLCVGVARASDERSLEAEQLEQRSVQPLAEDLLPDTEPAAASIGQKPPDLLKGLRGIVPPGSVQAQPREQILLGESASLAEAFAPRCYVCPSLASTAVRAERRRPRCPPVSRRELTIPLCRRLNVVSGRTRHKGQSQRRTEPPRPAGQPSNDKPSGAIPLRPADRATALAATATDPRIGRSGDRTRIQFRRNRYSALQLRELPTVSRCTGAAILSP